MKGTCVWREEALNDLRIMFLQIKNQRNRILNQIITLMRRIKSKVRKNNNQYTLYQCCLYLIMGAPFSKLAERQQFWNERKGKDLLIFKQGALTKQSKYLKHWRQRTILLVERYIVTFDDIQLQHPPTAIIPIHQLSALAKEEQQQHFLLKVITKSREEYRFRTESAKERDEWFQKIKEEKIRFLKNSNVTLSIVQTGDNRMTFLEDEELQTSA